MKATAKRLLLACALAGLHAAPLAAQSVPQYGLYLFGSPVVNPAFTGSKDQWYARMYYANHWVAQGTPSYANLTLDGSINRKVNLGLYIANERMGLTSNSSFAASYAYRLPLGELADISMGISLGGIYNGVDYNGFSPVLPDDPALRGLDNSLYPLIGAGVLYASSTLQAGISLRNISSSTSTPTFMLLPKENCNAVLTIASFIPATDRIDLSPSLMWQEDLMSSSVFDLTMSVVYRYDYRISVSFRAQHPLWKPATLSNPTAYALAFGGELFYRRFTISYTFANNLSSLVFGYFGEHEVSLGYYFTHKTERGRIFHFKKHTYYCPVCDLQKAPDEGLFPSAKRRGDGLLPQKKK
ncbi:MAG: PorP/SprF family type IX secretion system membrane protein [Prevotellaceae bacterium]|jgi:type IX secretion system PorP/SprF family membrane protein|nr:PorP/SprF family type IX secretion system membrane protein [Prevotellaceae bacterium]